jgi:hypothetical protein
VFAARDAARPSSTKTHTQTTHPHTHTPNANTNRFTIINNSDFCYADGTSADGVSVVPAPDLPTSAYHPLWEAWARLFEPLLSAVPLLHTPGNHVRARDDDGGG